MKVWVDGCFDMMHYGHANLLRQAKEHGDELIVGVHSDLDITVNKGPPVIKEEERYKAVMACKWVDKVIINSPYFTSLDVMDSHNCQFCVHGDDITTMQDGTDCYQAVKDANRYIECKRTIGISTTDLVDRILNIDNKSHNNNCIDVKLELDIKEKLHLFSNNSIPKSTDKIVYVAGDFDLFHTDHVDFLNKAKSLGDYLIVGIHSNEDIFTSTNQRLIMTQEERALGVLSCRYVDDIIMNAPIVIDEDFINKFNIQLIVSPEFNSSLDILHILPEFQNKLTNDKIINHIKQHYEVFHARNERKMKKAQLEESIKNKC